MAAHAQLPAKPLQAKHMLSLSHSEELSLCVPVKEKHFSFIQICFICSTGSGEHRIHSNSFKSAAHLIKNTCSFFLALMMNWLFETIVWMCLSFFLIFTTR